VVGSLIFSFSNYMIELHGGFMRKMALRYDYLKRALKKRESVRQSVRGGSVRRISRSSLRAGGYARTSYKALPPRRTISVINASYNEEPVLNKETGQAKDSHVHEHVKILPPHSDDEEESSSDSDEAIEVVSRVSVSPSTSSPLLHPPFITTPSVKKVPIKPEEITPILNNNNNNNSNNTTPNHGAIGMNLKAPNVVVEEVESEDYLDPSEEKALIEAEFLESKKRGPDRVGHLAGHFD